MILRTPETRSSRNAALPLSTGRKWIPSDTSDTSVLRHRDIMGQVQQGRGGFVLAANEPTWHKVITTERHKMVVDEERQQEQSAKSTKSMISLLECIWWEVLERGKINWKEIHHPASLRIEPSSRRGRSGPNIALPSHMQQPSPGQNDWKILTDISHQLTFPSEIAATSLRPDLVLWSTKSVYSQFRGRTWWRRRTNSRNCTALSWQQKQCGWSTNMYPVEGGCRGFVAPSTIRLLKE